MGLCRSGGISSIQIRTHIHDPPVVELYERTQMRRAIRRQAGEYRALAAFALVTLGLSALKDHSSPVSEATPGFFRAPNLLRTGS